MAGGKEKEKGRNKEMTDKEKFSVKMPSRGRTYIFLTQNEVLSHLTINMTSKYIIKLYIFS
jgi:hypothetical protein